MLLSVEVAQISTTMKIVLGLAPGSKLPASNIPSKSVDLIVDGKKIGKGEVVKIGDTWGIRITSLQTSRKDPNT